MSVPLAWHNLTCKPVRLVLFTAGICFAVVLMFVQFGCRNALVDSSVRLIEHIRADLVLRNKEQTTLMVPSTFPRDLLTRAAGVRGVATLHPLYLEYSTSFFRHTAAEESARRPSQTIRVIGVDPEARLLDFPELNPESPRSRVHELRKPGQALFDALSRRDRTRPGETVYGAVREGTETDLAQQRIRIVGEFELGVDFAIDGSLIVSTETFREYLRPPVLTDELQSVDFGLVRLAPGADVRQVQADLNALLSGEKVEALTRAEFIEHERRFWLESTPVGYVFGFGMLLGFFVGLVICYQILASNISDNLQAYATLRALGYRKRFLVGVVLQESVLLSLLGFIPGVFISYGIYQLLTFLTDLPLVMLPGRIAFVFFLSLSMCVGSGLLASRKARQADPAEVF